MTVKTSQVQRPSSSSSTSIRCAGVQTWVEPSRPSAAVSSNEVNIPASASSSSNKRAVGAATRRVNRTPVLWTQGAYGHNNSTFTS